MVSVTLAPGAPGTRSRPSIRPTGTYLVLRTSCNQSPSAAFPTYTTPPFLGVQEKEGEGEMLSDSHR